LEWEEEGEEKKGSGDLDVPTAMTEGEDGENWKINSQRLDFLSCRSFI
jgi:hypothetical protein